MALKFFEIGDHSPNQTVIPTNGNPAHHILNNDGFDILFSPVLVNPATFNPQRKVSISFMWNTELAMDLIAARPEVSAISQLKLLLMERMNNAIDSIIINNPDARFMLNENTTEQLDRVVVRQRE